MPYKVALQIWSAPRADRRQLLRYVPKPQIVYERSFVYKMLRRSTNFFTKSQSVQVLLFLLRYFLCLQNATTFDELLHKTLIGPSPIVAIEVFSLFTNCYDVRRTSSQNPNREI